MKNVEFIWAEIHSNGAASNLADKKERRGAVQNEKLPIGRRKLVQGSHTEQKQWVDYCRFLSFRAW